MNHFVFSFGTYKGKTLDTVAKENPAYLKWLSGAISKFSLKSDAKKAYEQIKTQHPEAIQLIKDYVASRKCKCCLIGDCEKDRECSNSHIEVRNYHYHPYGKRD